MLGIEDWNGLGDLEEKGGERERGGWGWVGRRTGCNMNAIEIHATKFSGPFYDQDISNLPPFTTGSRRELH